MEVWALILRTGLYGGVVLTAGSAMLRLTLSIAQSSGFSRTLTRQTAAGAVLVVLSSAGLVWLFLLAIAGGDAVLALSPEFFAIALQTPVGQAALFRVVGVVLIGLAAFAGSRWLMLIPAAILLLSFGWEGHSLSFGPRLVSMGLVMVHVGIMAWWLAVIPPLIAAPRSERNRMGHAFGRQALFAVPLLLLAGVVLLGLFTGWRLDLTQAYQQRMVIKLIAVSGILALAAANKLLLNGRLGFLWALRVEAALAVSILALTAWLTATGPDM